jgi:hypothetical protein
MLYRYLMGLGLLICWAADASAACSHTLRGISSEFDIVISDGACSYSSVMILVIPLKAAEGDSENDESPEPIPFDSQCSFEEDVAITCKADGVTPLAGAIYRAVKEPDPVCGTGPEFGYSCVSGCENGAPAYIRWEPYEC